MGPTDGEGDREEDITQLRDMAFEAPVVRLVNLLIEEAVASEASDIHIEPSEDTLRVRYRIDGILYDLEAPPRRLQAAVTSRIKLMAELNIAERRLPQDGRIRMTLEHAARSTSASRACRRSTASPSSCGCSTGPRCSCRSTSSGSARDTSAPSSTGSSTSRTASCSSPGPPARARRPRSTPRSTRSTCPRRRSSRSRIPSSTSSKGVNQIAVRPKIGLTFASGLRSIVRQDPDVIMVGEIRDLETAEISIHAALTGHLVFSTLHTNDAPGADHPTARHGRRAVSPRLRPERRARAAARAADLPELPRAVTRPIPPICSPSA